MKTPSNSLFELIKSLDKNEKRYFRLYAAKEFKNESTLYLQLFDAIEKQSALQEEYDEEKLKKSFVGTSLSKQLAFYKNYLYNHCLQCLRMYHANNSTDAYLKNRLQEIYLLFNKGLFRQCAEIIKEIKKVAVEHEKHLVLLEIHEWEGWVSNARADIKALEHYIKVEHPESKKTVESYSKQADMFNQLLEAYINIYSDAGVKLSETIDINEVKRLFDPAKDKNLNFFSQVYYYQLKATYYYFSNKLEQDYETRKKIYDLYAKHKHIANENPHSTFFTIYNYALSSFRIGKYTEAGHLIDVLRSDKEHFFKKRSKFLEANIFSCSYGLEMQQIVITGKYSGHNDLIKDVEEGLEKHGAVLNQSNKLTLYSLAAQILFGKKQFRESLNWINKVINEPDEQMRIDLRCKARLLNILAHYEMGNGDYLNNLYRNTIRFLQKNNRLYLVEKLLINFIVKELALCSTENQKEEALKNFKVKLQETMGRLHPADSLNYNFVGSWVESKLK